MAWLWWTDDPLFFFFSPRQLFPHPNGGTWRHSLRNLTKDVLRKVSPPLSLFSVQSSRAKQRLTKTCSLLFFGRVAQFIQEGDPTIGHSAKDDADAALELVRWKVKQHAAGKG